MEYGEKLGIDPIWLHVSNNLNIPLIDGIVGEEICKSIPMYIGRAIINGERFLVNVMPSKDKAYILHFGRVHRVTNFDLLVGDGYKWILMYKLNGNRLPPFAVRYGCSNQGQPLYIGRIEINGVMRIGCVDSTKGGLVIVCGDETILITKFFQLLIKPFYGNFLKLLED